MSAEDASKVALLADLLALRAESCPRRTFLLCGTSPGEAVHYTFADMECRANRVANLLRDWGVGKGGTFHIHLTNCVEFYDCWFAAAKLGAFMVPSNPLSAADEISYVISQTGSSVSITQPDLLEVVQRGRALSSCSGPIFLTGKGSIAGTESLQAVVTQQSHELRNRPDIYERDGVMILYTSGTTSRPKGVVVTNANYLFVGRVMAQHLRITDQDRILITLPLCHGNAQYYSTMPALLQASSIALMPRFSASQWARQVAQYDATVTSLFASPMRMLLAQPAGVHDRRNRLRVCLFAQNLTDEQASEFERRFGCLLLQLYGMSETIAPTTINPASAERRHRSIGRPGSWNSVRIVDEAGQEVPVGQVGQLIVHGEAGITLMAGYFRNPEATASTLRHGWLYTGDNVYADSDGFLYFVDRKKDMIKRGGENVATSEVERVINEHPGVFESAAIGMPDPVRDEAIKVFVVLRSGQQVSAKDLIAWCKERLARFKVPSFIEFVPDLPRTAVGKIQKHLLSRRIEES
jgi:carnitine-CoA ligase